MWKCESVADAEESGRLVICNESSSPKVTRVIESRDVNTVKIDGEIDRSEKWIG
jgi:hypothetical protein